MGAPDAIKEIGRYRVLEELGKGAMGRVLLAEDPVLKRNVAIKFLREDLSLADDQRKALLDRMRHEARASARVNHPHLVALFDMGEHPTLGLYLVFEYVEGPTLHERLQQGALSVEEGAKLVRELGRALSYAHGRGIVHRDVKPENVILSSAGSKLADFGIARLPDSTLTQGTGIVLGTPAYSAPEAIRNSKFSPRSDQFSLAATVYEAISGRRAFPGDDAIAVAARITNEEPQRIASLCKLDPAVDQVLGRALSKNPRARFGDCSEFGQALARALVAQQHQGAVPRPELPTLPDYFHQPSRKGPGLGSALLIAAASSALTWATLTFFEAPPPPTKVTRTAPKAEVVEENPAPVAWLQRSPEEPRGRAGSSKKEPATAKAKTKSASASKRGGERAPTESQRGEPDLKTASTP